MIRVFDFVGQYVTTLIAVWGFSELGVIWFDWPSTFDTASFIVVVVVVAVIQYFQGMMFFKDKQKEQTTELIGEEELMDKATKMSITDEPEPKGNLTDTNPLD